jgi:signal transduction histidine kinase
MKPKALLNYYFSNIKVEIALLLIAGLVAFTTGFLLISARNQFVINPQMPLLQEELQKFIRQTKPLARIQSLQFLEFLDPQKTIPQYQNYPFSQITQLEKAAKTCIFEGPAPKNEILLKAWNFQKFLCQKEEIPEGVATTPPFYHPSGETYAALVYKQLLRKEGDKSKLALWLNDHLHYFNILELKALNAKTPLDISRLPLADLIKLSWQELYQIIENQEIVMTESAVFLRMNEGLFLYQIYTRDLWEAYWKKSLFHPQSFSSETKPSQCFTVDSRICWRYDFNRSLLTRWNPLTLFLGLSVLFSLLLFFQLCRIMLKRKVEQEKLKFSLEMLTHELRTPMANLSLHAEELRNAYEQLPAETQMTTIRLLDQLARLLRITEASQNYLSKEIKPYLVNPKKIQVKSLPEYINYCVEPFANQLELKYSQLDSSSPILLDPYWTHICINNLVQNALTHGVAPVHILIASTRQFWSIEVRDHGNEVFNPQKKSHASKGMGLGLQLIEKILPYLGGTLFFEFKPTRFRLVFAMESSTALSKKAVQAVQGVQNESVAIS